MSTTVKTRQQLGYELDQAKHFIIELRKDYEEMKSKYEKELYSFDETLNDMISEKSIMREEIGSLKCEYFRIEEENYQLKKRLTCE